MPNPPSHTTVTNNAMRVIAGVIDDDEIESSVTAPSGFSDLIVEEDSGSGTGGTAMMAFKLEATAGALDPDAFGGTGSDPWWSLHMSFRPV